MSPPAAPHLPADEVHVWRAPLEVPAAIQRDLWAILSEDERVRARRFRFRKDRVRFVAARGGLRIILAAYERMDPAEMSFRYSDRGKPALKGDSEGSRLRFNVAHSHKMALYAVAGEREVGVDVEYIRPDVSEEGIAERFFSPREVAVLRGLPPALQPEAFFNCWTRKEAYLKAKGKGLSFPLSDFEVSLTPGEPAAILRIKGDPHEASVWSLRDLRPASGYAAALAVEGKGWRLRCYDLRWHMIRTFQPKTVRGETQRS